MKMDDTICRMFNNRSYVYIFMLVITLTFVLHNPVVDGSCQGTPNPGEVTHQAAQTYGDTDKHGKEGFHSTHVKVV